MSASPTPSPTPIPSYNQDMFDSASVADIFAQLPYIAEEMMERRCKKVIDNLKTDLKKAMIQAAEKAGDLPTQFTADCAIDPDDLDFMETVYTSETMHEVLGFTANHYVRVECNFGEMRFGDCPYTLPMMSVTLINTSAEKAAELCVEDAATE